MTARYSQTSRDRNALNLFIVIPLLATLGLIRLYQSQTGEKFSP